MRYYFNLRHNGKHRADIEGTELQTIEEVETEALLSAREMLAERVKAGTPLDVRTRFEVKDEAGNTVHTLLFAKVLIDTLTADVVHPYADTA